MLKTKGQEATGDADAVKRRKWSQKPEVEKDDGGRHLTGDSKTPGKLVRGQLSTRSFVSNYL